MADKKSSLMGFPGTTKKMLSSKFSTKYAPGDYAAYRKTLDAKKPAVKPANVIRNVTSEKLSPVKAMPTRMAVNPFTGNTTGFTTGKTTGTRVSKPGVAGKTPQSAYSRQMANAVERGGFSASKSGGAGKTSQSSTSRSSSRGGASSSSRGGGYMR
jgi:uncharacterized membrane protein YgcG